jgi:polyisoprenoid-binding protein YceI
MSLISKILSWLGIGSSNGKTSETADFLQKVREQRAGNFPKLSGWVVDNYHTSIKFRVMHMAISEIVGSFKDYNIEFKGASPDFSNMEVKATVLVSSIETDMLARDVHLKSQDFFDCEKFPHITFQSTSINWRPLRSFNLHGNLTIKDVTRPIVFGGKILNYLPKDMFGQPRVGFELKTEINRKDFGLTWQMELESGDKVAEEIIKIEIRSEIATRQGVEAMQNYLKQMMGH